MTTPPGSELIQRGLRAGRAGTVPIGRFDIVDAFDRKDVGELHESEDEANPDNFPDLFDNGIGRPYGRLARREMAKCELSGLR